MYADGSIVEGKVGVGVCRITEGEMRMWGAGYRLGGKMKTMDAEIVGIKKAIQKRIGECRRERKRRLTIRTDSQETMRRCKRSERMGGEMMASRVRWWWDAARENGIEVGME